MFVWGFQTKKLLNKLAPNIVQTFFETLGEFIVSFFNPMKLPQGDAYMNFILAHEN